uniref:Ig-like domain-containing protein n=1 Tax=Oryzias melastigma TaxID=30732 RepID=A0A3B3CGM8_ORYME
PLLHQEFSLFCNTGFQLLNDFSSDVKHSIGETVTLKCSHKGQTLKRIFWFKKSFGRKPELICSFYIFDFQFSDSATYNCIHSDSYILTFLESYSVHVKDPSSSIQTSLDQSSSENIHPGDSVTLNCTVHTGSCDGEHRVYWFKDSEDSHPGLIYTDGGRNDQCERKKNTQTHSCVYKLHMKNLIESHSGIYYCAVVSCGHILFGNGTKLDLTAPCCFIYFFIHLVCAKLWYCCSCNTIVYIDVSACQRRALTSMELLISVMLHKNVFVALNKTRCLLCFCSN